MSVTVFMQHWFKRSSRAGHESLAQWWHLLHRGASLLVLALSPSSYRSDIRSILIRRIYLNTAPILFGFTVVSALISVVLTRIVLVTALSYVLSQYALQLVIRVLVLELIPLTAALFVALRCTIPDGAELTAMRENEEFSGGHGKEIDSMRREVIPRVVAGLFSGVTLAALSSVVVLVVAYVASYGFSLSAFPVFTRQFGQIFSPAVSLIFAVKTMLFCLTVSLVPMASALSSPHSRSSVHTTSVRTSADMRGLIRMFIVILLVEVVSLLGNYY